MVNIGTLRDLCQLLSHSHYYTSSINSAHLKRDQPALPVRFVLQEPIRALLTLHPSHYAPIFRLVGDRKCDGFRAIFCDSVVIVLLGVGRVSGRPIQRTTRNCFLDSHVEVHSGGVLIPLQAKSRTDDHNGS
jgi:hypothetical protein